MSIWFKKIPSSSAGLMNDSLAPLLKIHRPDQATVHFVREVANTGEHPFLAVTTDDREFWCKRYNHDSQGLTVINEIVATEVGKLIGAPVRDWAVVYVPPEFTGRIMDSDQFFPSLPTFGSLHIHSNSVQDDIIWVNEDGNHGRIPLLIALWHLCNADDVQIIYDLEADAQIFSLDHGYWFGSWEGSRDLVQGMTLYQNLPELRGRIPAHNWEEAKVQVEGLTRASLKHIPSLIPSEWAVEESEIMDMLDYVVERVPYTIEILESYQRKYQL